MSANILTRYRKLDANSRQILQLFAVHGSDLSSYRLPDFTKSLKLTGANKRPLTQKVIRQLTLALEQKQFLISPHYGEKRINPAVQDLAIQDLMREKRFETVYQIVAKDAERRWYSHQPGWWLKMAFYQGDVEKYREHRSVWKAESDLRVFDPFCRDLFDQFDPVLQEMYLIDMASKAIAHPIGGDSFATAFEEMVGKVESPEDNLLTAWLDIATMRGSVDSLRELERRCGKAADAVAGCIALVQGDLDSAESHFELAFPTRGGKKRLNVAGNLPALFYAALLLRHGTPDANKKAATVIGKAKKARTKCFVSTADVFVIALDFLQSPAGAEVFSMWLKHRCETTLDFIFAVYLSKWLISEEEPTLQVKGLEQSANAYKKSGLDWLSAETYGLAADAKTKSADVCLKKHSQMHVRLGTKSLIGMIQPEAPWQRTLKAIARLGSGASQGADTPTVTERIAWELNTQYRTIELDAYRQKRTTKGWTKGRKVARSRLYELYDDPEFAFMTDQDRKICQALEATESKNYYGYGQTQYHFDDVRTAQALAGHPSVFRIGDRDNPLEIVLQQPQLIVAKEKGKRIGVSLHPVVNEDNPRFQMSEDGPHRVAMVVFSKEHLELAWLLGGKLSAPSKAADQVVEAIQPVASLISVHSEIGGQVSGERVEGDPLPHIHLLPYQEGIRVEFFVRPFGEAGPFCRPGQGGEDIYASIDGNPQTAQRNLAEETRREAQVLAACPEIAARIDGSNSICFPSAVEALEALVELEELVGQQQVVLHWPQGGRLSLAGSASASQFQVHVRKDRDWFAASGSLKVDESLSIDMMQLIDLVQATPGRFVELDDGRFLALTEQLRRRVEELAAYGDRRGKQNKLRFPRARAAVLEDLGETVKLKSDTHWKEWVGRMRDAAKVRPEIPSTLQTELRDYQQEGYQWLARLAAWGVGGCLADDMGLGKTIEALALLLERSAGGPALVIAPTSVAFNWINEARRFAPTLKPHLFGAGDRDTLFENLGPRDLVICSYGLLNYEAERLQQQPWHTVILDEAQAIKNTATQRSRSAMGLQADFRLIMTGTPVENHLGELWNLMEFINPGLLGSLESFQKRFATPIERDDCRETRRRLKKLIQPFILRRTKSQVLEELPSRTELTLRVELSKEEAAFYEALRQKAIENLADAEDDEQPQHLRILAEIMRLRRACCHPTLVAGDCGIEGSKLTLFSSTIDELLDNHHKALVFSQFVDHLSILRDELDRKGVSYQYLDGSTSAKKRKLAVEAFQAGQGDVFLISLRAGGLGLNLTAADYVIHMDPWWNPAVEDQASDRAHRLGQQRPVTIYRLITQGTIEEKISQLHASKRDLADSLLEGADMSGKLSAEELLKLIRE